MPSFTKMIRVFGVLVVMIPLQVYLQTAKTGSKTGVYPINSTPASLAYPMVIDGEPNYPTQDNSQAISICSQHAPKCPLTQAGWPGEPDGWQFTGKKWIWVPGTRDLNRSVVWEYSQPYSGSTEEYFGQREDHYAFCIGDPQDCSLVTGTHPVTYDWERWMRVGDNFKVMQLGVESESESHKLGDVDCNSGIYYPVVDHTTPYAYTSMYTDIIGTCTGDGYISAHLSEQWGEPLSQQRLALCDNTTNGVPSDLSPAGNTICKISPYVGVVFQRYVFDSALPDNMPSVGCEAVLYAWGWSEPRAPVSGQVYQTWFRNGELRFTRWYDLSKQVNAGNVPQPYDHAWWDSRCQGAWTGEGNWLYTGTFQVGSSLYHDQASIPNPISAEISTAGGTFDLENINGQYSFPQGTFTDTVQVVQYIPDQAELPPMDGHFLIAPAYQIFAEFINSQEIATPTNPYTVTLHYAGEQVGGLESRLALYAWDGHKWLKEPSSSVDVEKNTLVAAPVHFSLWAAAVEGLKVYLPHVLLDR